jgi:LysR family nitrogen assimilation transcriptional regulator
MAPLNRLPQKGFGGAVNALTPLGTPDRLPISTPCADEHPHALELRELRYFAAAARTGNLGRAAQELGVTPPAISQQLRKLEDALGTALLIRHGRGVTPTPAGDCLLERIDAIARLLNAPLTVGTTGSDTGATVSLALPAELAAVLAAPLVAQLWRDRPNLRLEFRECVAGGADTWLLGRQVDIAVLPDAPDLDELRIEPVLSESLGLVVPPRHGLAASALPLRLRDLAAVPLILPNQRHWIRRLLAKVGFQRGVHFDPVLQADGLSSVREMVRNGLGCSILPAAAVRDDVARGALVFRSIEQPAISVIHAIACHRLAAPGTRDIARSIADIIRSLAASGTWPGAQPCRLPAQPECVETEPDLPPDAWRRSLPALQRRNPEFVEGD